MYPSSATPFKNEFSGHLRRGGSEDRSSQTASKRASRGEQGGGGNGALIRKVPRHSKKGKHSGILMQAGKVRSMRDEEMERRTTFQTRCLQHAVCPLFT